MDLSVDLFYDDKNHDANINVYSTQCEVRNVQNY